MRPDARFICGELCEDDCPRCGRNPARAPFSVAKAIAAVLFGVLVGWIIWGWLS